MLKLLLLPRLFTTLLIFALFISADSIAQNGQVIFGASNPDSITEDSGELGCATSRIVDVTINSVQVQSETTIFFDVSASTATPGEDFDLLDTNLDVVGTSLYTIQLEVFDDGAIENEETITISFDFSGSTQTLNLALTDDDFVPILGNEPVELLTEGFDEAGLPEGWSVEDIVDTGLNTWFFNGTVQAAGTAYISDGTTTEPMYSGNNGSDPVAMDASSNALLVSPSFNTAGYSEVTVSFDWVAGGERDTDNAENLFDYGQFLYSIDGGDSFTIVENYVGTVESLGASPASGTFTMPIPELINETNVRLAFRWINDQLVGTAFSFTIDNVAVLGQPVSPATALDASTSLDVDASTEVFFVNDANGNPIAKIDNASQDLGCVTMTITNTGTSTVENTSDGFVRAEKTIQITSDTATAAASYNVTLFFTAEELASFADVSALKVLRVNGNDINDTSGGFTLASETTINDQTASGFATFTANLTGFSTFTVAAEATQSVNEFKNSSFVMYPNAVSRDGFLTISAGFDIEKVTIRDVRGATVKVFSENRLSNTIRLSMSGLSSGIYFVEVNNTRINSAKLIIR